MMLFMFALPGVYNGLNIFVVRRARSSDEIVERILYPRLPTLPNCRCTIVEPKKGDEK
jgi:hypothetical protein